MKIALVTSEFEGLTRNAGIGTAYRNLGELLLSRGHEVTVVFVPIELRAGETPKSYRRLCLRWKARSERVSALGFEVVIPPAEPVKGYLGTVGYFLGRSHLVHQFLQSRRFDVVHAPDNGGLLFLSLQARKLGEGFRATRFVIGAHGPRIWADELNGQVSETSVVMSQFDRRSIELADQLVSPSRYMLDHLRSRGWKLPRDSRVIPNVNRLGPLPRAGSSRPRRPTLVFFGRLERRKGIDLFAKAVLLLLARDSAPNPLRLVFLGKDPDPARATTARLRRLFAPFAKRVDLRFHGAFSSERSRAFLTSLPGALVCMPSLSDNSPYVLVEALESGLNWISTRSGGQAELVHPADLAKALCAPDASSLARMIERRLSGPALRIRPSKPALDAGRDWIRLHERRRSRPLREQRAFPRPRVSLVLPSRGPSWFGTLVSALTQDYENLEICVPKTARFRLPEKPGIRFVEYDPRASRSPWHSAAIAASGKYLLFPSAPLAGPSTIREWVRSAELLSSESAPQVATCGIARRGGISVDPFALWSRRWFLETCSKRPRFAPSPKSGRAIQRSYSSLLLRGESFGVFPKEVFVSPGAPHR